jgi:D-arabinose 1-dehydrogenase-like Zn-dependent alcohol dehydrogenase
VDGAEVIEAVRAIAPDGANAVIESTGIPALLETARGLLRSGGRVSALGYKVGATMSVSSRALVLQEQSIIGSRFASRATWSA